MKAVLFVLALLLMGAGGLAVAWGAPIIMLERGAVLVASGTVAFSAGVIVAALGAILGQLIRLSRPVQPAGPDRVVPDPVSAPADDQPRAPLAAAASPEIVAEDLPLVLQGEVIEPGAPEPAPPEPAQVVGSYASRNGSYLMYSDGSIEAKTSAGLHRFTSLDELKAFVDGPGA